MEGGVPLLLRALSPMLVLSCCSFPSHLLSDQRIYIDIRRGEEGEEGEEGEGRGERGEGRGERGEGRGGRGEEKRGRGGRGERGRRGGRDGRDGDGRYGRDEGSPFNIVAQSPWLASSLPFDEECLWGSCRRDLH